MQTSRNIRTIPALDGSSDYVVFRRGPAGVAIQAEAREDEQETLTVGPFDLDELRTVLDHLAATPEEPLGAYQRHEKHDAVDFARAEFARHPGGMLAMTPQREDRKPWLNSLGGELSDAAMARKGWYPVRECPDPEQHRDPLDFQTSFPSPAKGMRYQRERDEARAMAALWKETAREHIGRARTALSYASAVQVARAVASVTPCSCSAQRARAEKAERERVEALRTLKEVLDSHDETLRDIAEGKYAAESRPLTPDAITDQIVDYVHEDYFWSTSDRVRLEKPALKHALLDAVKRLAEASARPEGAEEIERLLMDADRDGGEVYRTDGYTRLADYLAEGHSKGGFRAPEDGAA